MTTLLIILAVWLLPGLFAWLMACASSWDWRLTKDDAILLIPVVNMVAFGLVMIITFDEWFENE